MEKQTVILMYGGDFTKLVLSSEQVKLLEYLAENNWLLEEAQVIYDVDATCIDLTTEE